MMFGTVIPYRQMRLVTGYNSVGANSNLSFAYHIRKASLTLSIGFRYQYLKTIGEERSGLEFDQQSDHFYGGIFSAVYSFEFSGKNSKDAGE